MKIEINRITLADSYKYSHAKQYPEMISMYDYMESRGGKYPKTVFVGAQYYIKLIEEPIQEWEVKEAYEMAKAHGVPFDIDGWMYIVNELKGKLPIRIKAVKEGSVIPVKNVLMTFESTDPKVPWIAGWVETLFMKIWYPVTIATKSYYMRKTLEKYGSPEWAQFAFHNFGDRGSSSIESAAIGGFAHSTIFLGTDNFNSIRFAKEFYNEKDVTSYSVFATEHSTTTANANGSTKNEIEFVQRMLNENPDAPIMSFVADSYDVYNFTNEVTKKDGKIRPIIESRSNQKLVIRPDSGNPMEVLPKMLDIMERNDVFDIEINGKKASSKYGILWGDGITPEVIEEILIMITEKGYAAENMVFGSGGDLMQNLNRDTQKFAIKCSSITKPDGTEQDVFKNPITDPGKTSKKGKVTTYFNPNTNEYFTDRIDAIFEGDKKGSYEVLDVIFENGEIKRETSLSEIRAYIK